MKDDMPHRPAVHALLADGTTIRIRAVEPGDHDQLEGLYAEMSPENLRLRFFSAGLRSAGLAADDVCAPADPILATPGEVTVLDARIRLLPRRPQDPCLRRLR
jgi:hypothetical protein